MHKQSAQGPVPPERYNLKAFYHPDGSRSGSMNVPGGYFLDEDVRQFDNSFFGINNLEATYMDPQQRKLLEVVFECFESAGTSMDSVSGSNAGVFVGNFSVDYQPMQTRDPDYLHRYTSTGSGATIMSNRISHIFNLRGPRSVSTFLLLCPFPPPNLRSFATILQPHCSSIACKSKSSVCPLYTELFLFIPYRLFMKLSDFHSRNASGIPDEVFCFSEDRRFSEKKFRYRSFYLLS